MDPRLVALAEAGTEEDEIALVLKVRDGVMPLGVRVVARFGDVATVRMRRGRVLSLRESEMLVSMKVAVGLRPDVEPAPSEIDRAPGVVERPEVARGVTGRDVVVAVIDWGLDFTHKDFRRPDGGTRLLALWDQRSIAGASTSGKMPRYGYGRVHTRADIDAALAKPDPFAALVYDPSLDDTGDGTHGTHTMGIAAGNGRAGGPAGIAPEAHLVFVHLAPYDGDESIHLADSVTLLEALDFVREIAGSRPWVVNMSLGAHAGPHDATTLVEQALDRLVVEAPGRAIVMSVGNYFNKRIHTEGIVAPGRATTFYLEIEAAKRAPSEIDIWYSWRDRLTVQLIAPDGRASTHVAPGERGSVSLGGTEVARIVHRAREPNSLDNNALIVVAAGAPAGAWEVRLFADDVVSGRWSAWVERSDGAQARLREADARPYGTTGTICNGYRTIAVGAIDGHAPELTVAPFSSAGPLRREDRRKPDVVAHGVRVLGPRSATREARDEYVRKSGTSMAAPCVAGTVALMFEAARRPLAVHETRALLSSSATPPPEGSDRERLGAGVVDIVKAVEAARAVGARPAAKVAAEESALHEEQPVEAADTGTERGEGTMEANAVESGAGGTSRREAAPRPGQGRFRHEPLGGDEGPNVEVRWNVDASTAASGPLDIVVYLHGFDTAATHTLARKAERAGVDLLDPEGHPLARAGRPTLVLIPRGERGATFVRECRFKWHFQSTLGTRARFEALVRHGLDWLALSVLGAGSSAPLRPGRLTLLAHSGGGAGVSALLGDGLDPDELVCFDSIYGDPRSIVRWARGRIRSPRAGTSGLRVFYTHCNEHSEMTEVKSRRLKHWVDRALRDANDAGLAARFRVERTAIGHEEIPARYAPALLDDIATPALPEAFEPPEESERPVCVKNDQWIGPDPDAPPPPRHRERPRRESAPFDMEPVSPALDLEADTMSEDALRLSMVEEVAGPEPEAAETAVEACGCAGLGDGAEAVASARAHFARESDGDGEASLLRAVVGEGCSAVELFEQVAGFGRRAFAAPSHVEIVGRSGRRLASPLQAGDLVVRRLEGRRALVGVVSDSELLTAEQVRVRGLPAERRSLGRFATMLEASPDGRGSIERARVVLGEGDVVPFDQVIVRRILEGALAESRGDEREAERVLAQFPASGIMWRTAPEEGLEFARAVYEAQILRAARGGARFVNDLAERDLRAIGAADRAYSDADRLRLRELPGHGHVLHVDVVDDARRLVLGALDAWAEARARGDESVRAIGIGSAYRTASWQFEHWVGHFPRYYGETAAARERLAGGRHGAKAVSHLAAYIGGKFASPGMSNHNHGRAVDFRTTDDAHGELGANTRRRAEWRGTWLHGWLVAHAGEHSFVPLATEEWHWDHQTARRGRARARGHGQPAEREGIAEQTSTIVEVRRGTTTSPLANAWVYTRPFGTIIATCRTDGAGALFGLRINGDATKPWDYTVPEHVGATVAWAFSRGAVPIPGAVLRAHPGAFVTHAGGALVALDDVAPAITAPADLGLFCVTHDAPRATYPTDGLAQGAALWTKPAASGALTVAEGGPAPAAGAAVRARERALTVTGTIDAGATGATVSVVDDRGVAVGLVTASSSVNSVPAVLGTAFGGRVPFTASLVLADAARAFGPVHVIVASTGAISEGLASVACSLVGVQLGVSVDAAPATRGPILGAASDVIVVDFDQSPQLSTAALSAQTRARRMLPFEIGFSPFPLSAADPTPVQTPSMPLFRIELQLLGLEAAPLAALLERRRVRVAPTAPLVIDATFALRFTYDGPDTAFAGHAYREAFDAPPARQVVTLVLDPASHVISGITPAGEIMGALSPVPLAPARPPGRVSAAVRLVAGRGWGREAGATTRAALVVEWQPSLGAPNRVRGGDATVSVETLRIDGAALTAPAGRATCTLPAWRISGSSASIADLRALTDRLVAEHHAANAANAANAVLPLAAWQATARAIFDWESHRRWTQFRADTARERWRTHHWGQERGMPFFGPPHGFGIVQMDDPGFNDDQAWSFLENLRGGVDHLMRAKATMAFNDLRAHFSNANPALLSRRERAVFQRQVVRRYNGGTEFSWDGAASDWVIRAATHDYPNNVFPGQAIAYDPVNTVPFPNAAFGPGI